MSAVVKICGITNIEDGMAAAAAGADALGFVFWKKSPRAVSVEAAAEIIHNLPPLVMKVGVFVDPEPELVVRAIRESGITLLQFHGSESPDFCTQFGLMSLKAFRVKDDSVLDELPKYETQGWLLDAYTAGVPGGTGEKFNWDIAIRARELGRPIFLAGGLTCDNVAEAIRTVRPYAVDVSSGVEKSPGRKDHDKVRTFIEQAKR